VIDDLENSLRVRHDNLDNLAGTANDDESKIQRVSAFRVDRFNLVTRT
jgi:hypothetical protein